MSNDIFAIGIPTINRADLLNPTLEKYARDYPGTQIVIMDNGDQQIDLHPNVRIERPWGNPRRNLGVAASWNELCRQIFSGPLLYGWILNDDIYMGRTLNQIMNLIGLSIGNPANPAPFIAPPGNWSNFLISRDIYDLVGPFDEGFYPAYYEDNDYRYRMKLARTPYVKANILHPEVFRKSQSLEKDPSLNAQIADNLTRYIKKWGGPPDEETFRKPFDGKAL